MIFGKINPDDLSPIPDLKSVDGYKEVPIIECGEPLVPMGAFTPYSSFAFTIGVYWGEMASPYQRGQLEGAVITVFVREGVARRLKKVAALLPERYMLVIFDGWRAIEVQRSLFYRPVAGIRDFSKEEEGARIKIVSLPSLDPKKPSRHNTGGVIDLGIVFFEKNTWERIKKFNKELHLKDWQKVYRAESERQKIFREEGKLLDMGVPFDKDCEKTPLRFYEKRLTTSSLSSEEEVCLKNRRLLYWAIKRVGLEFWPYEPWDCCYGEQTWSRITGKRAIYGAIELSPQNENWEMTRQNHFKGCLELWGWGEEFIFQNKLGYPSLSFVREVAKNIGNISDCVHPQAAII